MNVFRDPGNEPDGTPEPSGWAPPAPPPPNRPATAGTTSPYLPPGGYPPPGAAGSYLPPGGYPPGAYGVAVQPPGPIWIGRIQPNNGLAIAMLVLGGVTVLMWNGLSRMGRQLVPVWC